MLPSGRADGLHDGGDFWSYMVLEPTVVSKGSEGTVLILSTLHEIFPNFSSIL